MSHISAAEHPKSHVTVNAKQMAYVSLGSGGPGGSGMPVVFVHGNPTSSYLWRNIMPYVSDSHSAVAPDLIGMGDSDKLDDPGPDSYTLKEHLTYFDGFMEAIVPEGPVVLVVHDWGTAIGLNWARRHAQRVSGICLMEGVVYPAKGWDLFPEAARPVFQGFRSPAGEDMVLENNIFVERVLPGSIIRELSDEEMTVYRRPYLSKGEDRRPTLTWPRQIPIAGEPAEVVEIVQQSADFMAQSQIPKLFINAEPGAIVTGGAREIVRSWPNLSEVTVKGVHFIQEDSPHEIGTALKDWLARI